MNPIDIIRSIRNPKAEVMNIIKNSNNPMLANMVNLAQQGKTKELENIVRNVFKEKGIDYDKEISNLKNNINQL